MLNRTNNEDDRREGTGPARIVAAMRKYGFNQGDKMEFATVTNPPPELRIKVDNMTIELEKEDLMVAEWLTKHKRIISIRKMLTHDPQFYPKLGPTHIRDKSTKIDSSMSPEDHMSHTHTDYMIEMDHIQDDFNFDMAEVTFDNILNIGDRVIVQSIDEGQTFVIIDRVVRYE